MFEYNISKLILRPVVAQRHKCVTVNVTGCGYDPHSRKGNIYFNFYFLFIALESRQSATLRSATVHAMPPELGGKYETKCFNTRFPLLTLVFVGA